jgi:hypothetical protein
MRIEFLKNIIIIEDNMIQKIKDIFSKIKKRLFGKLCECLPKKKKGRGRPPKTG